MNRARELHWRFPQSSALRVTICVVQALFCLFVSYRLLCRAIDDAAWLITKRKQFQRTEQCFESKDSQSTVSNRQTFKKYLLSRSVFHSVLRKTRVCTFSFLCLCFSIQLSDSFLSARRLSLLSKIKRNRVVAKIYNKQQSITVFLFQELN